MSQNQNSHWVRVLGKKMRPALGLCWGIILLLGLLMAAPCAMAKPPADEKPAPVIRLVPKQTPGPLPVKPLHPDSKPDKTMASGLEQVDVYGVVTAVKNIGAPPAGSLAKPIESDEILQKVTVRLDASGLESLGLTQRTVVIDNVLGENPAYNIPLKPGARVLLNLERTPAGQWNFYIANRDRTPAIMILGTLFIMAVLMIGGPEVAKHALLVTLMLVGAYKALFPAILSGTTGPNWILLMCFMFTILASFIYQTPGRRSFNREQSVVILGTLGGLTLLSLILWMMHEITPLNGFSNEGLAGLWYQSPRMDYWTFFMSGALLGFQGLLFYLCWTLAQNRKEPDGAVLNFNQRYQVIMLRGRRMLGPILSSVGLLFLGLFMPILLQLQGTPTAQFVNLETTASMLAYAFAGGFTLLLTVPLTAFIGACLLSDKPPSFSEDG